MAASIHIITHLIEQESKAEIILAEAQEEANRRIAHARALAEEAYKSRYEQAMGELEESNDSRMAKTIDEYAAALESYRTSLGTSTLDFAAFNNLLEKRLTDIGAPDAR